MPSNIHIAFMPNTIKVTTTVNAPVEKVWGIFMDPDSMQHWLTGFISAEHISGPKVQPGSVNKIRFKERGREIEVIETVLEVRANEQYSFRMEHKSLESLITVRFVSIGQVTEIIQTVQFSAKGFFMKLMMPLMKGGMKKGMLRDLQNLKSFIESK